MRTGMTTGGIALVGMGRSAGIVGVGCFIFINVITFALYGIDKRKAVKNQWRVRERTLLLLAAAGGVFGAWLGMNVFHHKTKHRKFTILVPVFAVAWIVLLVEMLRVWK